MTDPSNPSDKPGAPRRRPSPTIDLKATEVAGEAGEPKAAPENVRSSPAGAQDARSAPGASDQPSAGARPEAKAQSDDWSRRTQAESSTRRQEPRRSADAGRAPRRSSSRRLFGAAAMAAIIIGLIAGGIWIAGPNRQEKQLTALSARLDSLESDLRSLADQAKRNAVDPERVAAIDGRLSASEGKLGQIAEMSDKLRQNEQALGRLNELPQRLAAAEQNMASLRGIDARLTRLEKTLSDARASGSDAALNERMNAAETSTKSLVEQVHALAGRLDRLATVARGASQQAASNEQLAIQSAGSDRALRYAFAANALRAAIERGAPFAGELGVVKQFASDGAELQSLEALADTGVPSNAALARDFSALTRDMLATLAQPPREEGIFDRLQARAERLVRIRPVNEVAGDDPAAIVARIEGQLKRGDIRGALVEFDKLPPAARQPAEDWRRKAEQRVEAIEISRRLSERAVGALGEPAQ